VSVLLLVVYAIYLIAPSSSTSYPAAGTPSSLLPRPALVSPCCIGWDHGMTGVAKRSKESKNYVVE
jgi:hypothetical protein